MKLLRLWFCALTLLLLPQLGARAQDMTISVSYTARGMQFERNDKGEITSSKLPQGQTVTMTITVKGGTPPYQVWVDIPNGGATQTLTGKGPKFTHTLTFFNAPGAPVQATAHADDSVGRRVASAIPFQIVDPLSPSQPAKPVKPVKTKPNKPQPPKPPVVPGTSYTPIRNITITGPSKVKGGTSESWVGTFSGGEPPYQYRWRAEGTRGTRVIDGKTSISAKFTRGPVKLTFLVWDDHGGTRGSATTTVQVEEPAKPAVTTAPSDSIGGYWLWIRGDDDLVPVYLTRQNEKGIYNGVYFPTINMKSLRQTGSTSNLAFKRISEGKYRYRYSYPTGEKGSGTMTVSGKRATGTWKDDPPRKGSGIWTWGRPDATALKRLKVLLGNRPDER